MNDVFKNPKVCLKKRDSSSLLLFSLLPFLCSCFLGFGCANLEIEEAAPTDKNNECSSRWQPNSSQNQSYGVPIQEASYCRSGPQRGAVELGNFFRSAFSPLMDLKVPGDGVQIFNCRSVRGGSSLSLHGEGRAIDLFIPVMNGRADSSKGDLIANWLASNAQYLGIQRLIWNRTIWTAPTSTPTHRCYTGDPHINHIHLELTWEAANRQSLYFTQGQEGLTPFPSIPNRWIGDECNTVDDCIPLSGYQSYCLLGTDGRKTCTFSCEGYCPDRIGEAISFCVAADQLNSSVLPTVGGLCVLQSLGTQCEKVWEVQQSHPRFVGNSTASNTQTSVCIPQGIAKQDNVDSPQDVNPNSDPIEPEPTEPEPTDPEPTEPEPMEPEPMEPEPTEPEPMEPEPSDPNLNSRNQEICEDPSLELSDHDLPCSEPENTWRCACSERYQVPISQVCRSGNWITFETNPSDCSRCRGAYTSGCAP